MPPRLSAFLYVVNREADIVSGYTICMGLWDRIWARANEIGIKTQEDLSRAVKGAGGSFSQPQISALKNGTLKRPRSLPEIALALQTTSEWLLDDDSQGASQTQPISNIPLGQIVTAAPPLIEWRSADDPGRAGALLIHKVKAGTQARPLALVDVPEAFAVKMRFDDMSPAFEIGWTLLINPVEPIAPGKNYLFVRGSAKSPYTGLPRRLVRWTDDHWIARSYAPEVKDIKLAKAEWTPWHIFGSYSH